MAGETRIPLFVVGWILLLAVTVDAKLVIHMDKVEVINNYKYANATASIRRFGPSLKNYVADFRVEAYQTLTNAMVSTIYYVPNLAGKYEKAFYNRTINFCTYLRQPTTDRVLRLVYENLNQRGNLPKRCPIVVGTYSFNTSFDGLHLPGFLPESRFRFDLNFYCGAPSYELLFHGYWYGALRRVSS
ncbi:uncharacterized protein LOC126568524 [Anopheles maculipalpis]|uniref:uncharacterized protein LOC126568524 n=1 Tax=Anopheles maculipalpis TaxID=1496333 RepID=UPI002159824F|nr:uncharacterized protein LOC126568524 [Anopheles maculipalpis]